MAVQTKTRRAARTKVTRASRNGAGTRATRSVARTRASRNGAPKTAARATATRRVAKDGARNGGLAAMTAMAPSGKARVAVAAGKERIFNCIPSKERERDWRFEQAATIAARRMAVAPLPKSVDLREGWWKIGDQLMTGSCVGWAAADGVMRWHLVKAGMIATNEQLSQRFAWMASKETDEFRSRPTTFLEAEGTSLKAALDVARRWGLVLDRVLPFNTGKLFPGDASDFYAIASQLKIRNYFNIGVDATEWRRAIATNGPILARLVVDSTFMNAKNTGGVLTRYVPPPDPQNRGHAVSIVGYTNDRFIIRNSWGTRDWGDQGFGYASLRYILDAFTESYGVTV